MQRFLIGGRMAALALLAGAPSPSAAQDVSAGTLSIQRPWARATPKGAQVAGGYLTITNHGNAPDALTGSSLEAADKADVHDMKTENGVMTMRPAGAVEIPPGASVILGPSGRHIMFTGLKRGLRQGEEVAGTLTFARAGTVPIRFTIEAIGAKAPSAAPTHSMPGMTMD